VRVGQGGPSDAAANAHLIEFAAHGAEAGLDVAQAFAIGQLRQFLGMHHDHDEAEKKRREEEETGLEQELGHDDSRSLFDVLSPQLGDRTLKMAAEPGVQKEEIKHLRPWLAYSVINEALFYSFHFEVSG